MMSGEDRRLLQRSVSDLVQHVDIEDNNLLMQLINSGILRQQQKDIIEHQKENTKQAEKMLEFLEQRGGEDTIDKPVYSLRASGQAKAAEAFLREPQKPGRWSEARVGNRRKSENDVLVRSDGKLHVPKRGTLTLENARETRWIDWKQGSFLGFGGDMHEPYQVCDYSVQGSRKLVTVFIHKSEGSPPQKLVINHRMQYGTNDGIVFMVCHDKNRYKPFQHRFIRNESQKILFFCVTQVKTATCIDLSWIARHYLRDC